MMKQRLLWWIGLFCLVGCRQVAGLPEVPAFLSLQGEEGQRQLVWQSVDGEQVVPLTPPEWDVWQYVVSPDGAQVVVSVGEETGTVLWLVEIGSDVPRQLVRCEGVYCGGMVWRGDVDAGILYEQRTGLEAGVVPELWWLDVGTGETGQVDLPSEQAGFGMQYAPNGLWFSVASPLDHSVVLVNLETGEEGVIHVHTDQAVVWRPDGAGFVVVHDRFDGVNAGNNLLYVDVATHETQNLSGDLAVTDRGAVWSPDGTKLLFSRRFPRTFMGGQMWVWEDGEARALTDDVDFHYAGMDWSADGKQVLFQRVHLRQPEAVPEVGVLDVETGAIEILVEKASWPVWWQSQ